MAGGGEPLESGISVDLNGALEVLQMRYWSLGLTIRAVEVDRRRRIGAPAELAALKLLHDQTKPLDLGLRLGEGSGALGGQRAHGARSSAGSSVICTETNAGAAASSCFHRRRTRSAMP